MLYERMLILIGCCLYICTLLPASAHAEVTGQDLIDGMEIPDDDVGQLKSGAVLAYSNKEYENSDRELVADAMVVIHTNLDAVHKSLVGATTLIPAKVILEDADINSEADFAAIKFGDGDDEYEEVERLFDAKRGKKFNFSDAEFAALRTHLEPYKRSGRAEKTTAASAAIRELLLNRYRNYRESGLSGIAGYQRSRRKVIDIGQELGLTTATFQPFADDFPEFYNMMVNYPAGTECCENYFRWLKVEIQDRPTFALSHTMIQKTEEFVLYTERHYFVSNSLNSVQITLGWVPYEDGTYMGLGMSASADILDSIMGKMLRPLGRNKAKDLVTDVMTEVRDLLTSDSQSSDRED